MEENEKGMMVSDFSEMMTNGGNNRRIYTTITNQKQLFNLETTCDFKINDCKGEKIRVMDLVIKINEKKRKEPLVDEETGEIITDIERTIVTILIDDQGKSYVTASKLFGMQMINYVKMFGLDAIKEGLEIKIIERPVKNSPNKGLGFELI